MKGIIKQYFESRGFGFIATENGEELYFRSSYMVNNAKPIKGAAVGFKKRKCAKGFEARNIIYVHETSSNHTSQNRLVFEEISRWKLDAKLEDMCRYFYRSNEYELIMAREKCYFIGRKGSGKTAICNHICSESTHDKFSLKLSFKNFPFNKLYALSDSGYSAPNQYITLWKYVIYSNICKLMILNEAIDPVLREDLKVLFRPELKNALSKEITEWTKKGFKLKFPGIEINSEFNQVDNDDDHDWIDKVDVLERVILSKIDDSNYYVMFDELDEDYSSSTKDSDDRYMDLLIGLFKAAQDIVSKSLENNKNILPVIFLRDDIYRNIKGGSDKTKWSDFKEEITWDKYKIKRLLAYRISKASDSGESVLSFDEAWFKLFDPELIGNKTKLELFDFIDKLTLGRPRDYIHYLKLCADNAMKYSLEKINARVVKASEIPFSSYLRSEFEDELNVEVKNIHDVFNIISSINKATFSAEEFSKIYMQECGSEALASAHGVLYVLYKFGVIGYYSDAGSNIQISVINHPDSTLNITKKLYIHRGLYKALQIY